MAKKALPRPTDAELEILRVMWRQGPGTVREIHETLAETRQVGYTTVLKMLQIMSAKGLVQRDEQQRAHVYRAALREEQTQQQIIGDVLERVFDGSALNLLMQALASKRASTEELDQIRTLLNDYERGQA